MVVSETPSTPQGHAVSTSLHIPVGKALRPFGEDMTWVAPTGLRCLVSMQFSLWQYQLSSPRLPCFPRAGQRNPFPEMTSASKQGRSDQIRVSRRVVRPEGFAEVTQQYHMSQCP